MQHGKAQQGDQEGQAPQAQQEEVKVLDWMADWLHDSLSPRARLRFGILTVLVSIPWTILAILLTDEPANVVLMSGCALVLTGITIIVAAEVMERGE